MTSTDITAMPPDASGLHPVGRLPMHALRRAPEIDLDGEWDFQLLPAPDAQLGEQWKSVQVPSLWTMSQDADRPHYTNVAMPFDEVPPAIPAQNPTGVYRRVVDLAPDAGRRTILHVGAAEGLLRVFLNGTPIGLSTDAHLAAEFDLTGALVAGANTIELVVAKWSAASYLEDQDHWWHSGLARSVFLYTVPQIRLADVSVVADYDPAAELGSLMATVSTAGLGHLPEVDWSVRIEVLGRSEELPVAPRFTAPTLPEGATDRSTRPEPQLPPDFMDIVSIHAARAPIPPELRVLPAYFAQNMKAKVDPGTAVFTLDELDVAPWSAETPHLEDLVVRLIAPDGAVADETRLRIGFRRVRIEGRDLLVNGERILVQGVNRHDVDPRTGRVMAPEALLAELSLLKRCNVNAIRTSHYPNDPCLLDLCDEIGFYVIAEADIEAHAFASTMPHDVRYLPEFLRRVSRMVLRDRNHPAVIAWSLGNETGYGANHDAAAAWVRRVDPTRPVHYEGAISANWHEGHAASDLLCPMYASFQALAAYAADPRADRPLILCEYAYSQGNSTGGLAHYWELFETLPGLQGGFIWEFKDHALDPDGDGRYRYGGDFGDQPNDGAVCLNGVVFPDLTPKPALYEMRGVFSPVRIVSDAGEAQKGTLRLRNRQTFADLSAYELELRVETASGPAEAVTVPTPQTHAGQESTLDLPSALRDLLTDAALALTLTVRTREDARWAPAGTQIAVEQVVIPREPEPLPRPGTGAAPGKAPVGADGDLRHPLLSRSPQLALWRALTDNDASYALDQRFVRPGFFRLTATDVQIDRAAHETVVTTRYRAAFGDEVVHRRTIAALAEGDFLLSEQVTLPEDTRDGLRIGMRFDLVDGFEHARWVGLGPWENYPDRRSAALLGAWESTIDALAVPYLVPQENGTRGDVTTLRLTGPRGEVRTTHATPLHMNVSRYSPSELEEATHWWKLPPSGKTVVHLDIAHRGVGTGLLGPDTRPQYRPAARHYAWEWRLTLAENP